MLHNLLKLVFRHAEPKPAHPANLERIQQHGHARALAARPSTALLAQILRDALAQQHASKSGAFVAHQLPEEASPRPHSPDEEQPDSKVIPLIPRQRPAPEKTDEPPRPEDDPGPSAA